MKLIAGLGNPGNRYVDTRHNIGFSVVEQLSDTTHSTLAKHKFGSVYATTTFCGIKTIICKPLTYMNASGRPIAELASYFAVKPSDILVVHDDMDITFGMLQIKTRGGSAGHRGISSILQYLKSDEFLRIRVGIGKPPPEIDPAAYVLQKFTSEEKRSLHDIIHNTVSCITVLFQEGLQDAMCRFHRNLA